MYKELKRGTYKEMLKMKTPTKLLPHTKQKLGRNNKNGKQINRELPDQQTTRC